MKNAKEIFILFGALKVQRMYKENLELSSTEGH